VKVGLWKGGRDCLEFQQCDGTWRILDEQDVQFHFWLHIEVSKWLLRYKEGVGRYHQSSAFANEHHRG